MKKRKTKKHDRWFYLLVDSKGKARHQSFSLTRSEAWATLGISKKEAVRDGWTCERVE
ncbi:MAG TPA: hypothetical protein VE135_13755 [Pyrinomonadaceae bacterium]|nr:hypothetical protein [Pyrinomonadaceae bacterium]